MLLRPIRHESFPLANGSQFEFFLNRSPGNKAVLQPLAERLLVAVHKHLKVWFDEWVLKPGDNIPAKIEERLEHSHVLVLYLSAQAFGSDWAQLEAGTFRFRDPLNKKAIDHLVCGTEAAATPRVFPF